jgi:hypothetical protein
LAGKAFIIESVWLTKNRHNEMHSHPHMEICLKHLNCVWPKTECSWMTALVQWPFLNRNLLSIGLWHSHNTLSISHHVVFIFISFCKWITGQRVNMNAGSNVWLLKNRTGKCIQGLSILLDLSYGFCPHMWQYYNKHFKLKTTNIHDVKKILHYSLENIWK